MKKGGWEGGVGGRQGKTKQPRLSIRDYFGLNLKDCACMDLRRRKREK
jgi:hypothetical protein